jgi:uncharacterized phiE125 gp8 family phage protein
MRQVASPQGLPLSLPEIKQYLRIDHDFDDALLTTLAKAATEQFEQYTGMALMPQIWRFIYEDEYRVRVLMPITPVLNIEKVEAGSGRLELVNPSRYRLEGDELVFDTFTRRGTFAVECRCGYRDANSVPDDIKQGLLSNIAFSYENRSGNPAILSGHMANHSVIAQMHNQYKKMRI